MHCRWSLFPDHRHQSHDQKESRNSRVKLAVHEWRTYGAQKYSSQIECAKAHGINQSTLNRRLRDVNVSHEEARQRIRSRRSPATETIAALSAAYVPPNMPMAVYTTVKQFDYKVAATDPKHTGQLATVNPVFVIYDKAFEEVIGTSPSLSLIDARPEKFAHEAGVYIRKMDRTYFTSNYQSGKSVQIHSVGSDDRRVLQHSYPEARNANGGCCYKDQILLCAQGDYTHPSALVLVDPTTSTSQTILNNFHGRPFNSLNDVVVHHANDDLWFTDPTYGYEQAFRPAPQLPSQIYRFKPSTGQIWCVAEGFSQCNGLCFSPDYTKMYVTDTGAVQAHGTPGNGHNFSLNPRLPSCIYEYDVIDNGTRLASRKLFAYCTAGVPDGIKCDEAGNVYAGCGDGIHVWDPTGLLIGKIYVGTVVANFNFARRGVWVLAEERLFFADIRACGALGNVEGHGGGVSVMQA
jgi:gluconolactonase